jgi:hypothetical protein
MKKSILIFILLTVYALGSDSFLSLNDETTLKIPSTLTLDSGLPVLPGGWDIAYGYDLLRASKMAPVFDITYKDGQTTYDGKYQVPDGLAWLDTNTCNLFATTETSDSYSQYKTTDTSSFSLEGSYSMVSGSLTSTETQVREQIFNQKNVVSKTYVDCKLYDVQHFDTLSPSMFFKNGLKGLTETYDETKYINFIKTFGTHYRKRITLGGKLTQYTFTSEEYKKDYSMDEIKRQGKRINIILYIK